MQNVNKVCNNQDRFISAQKLCNFDIHEYAKVFEVLGYDFKEELAILSIFVILMQGNHINTKMLYNKKILMISNLS